MNKLIVISIIVMTALSAHGSDKIFLSANGRTATATLESNDASRTLLDILSQGPLTLSMTDNGGFEKVGTLPQSLPTSDVRQTASPGDIMLYVGNVFCVFFGSNTWAYTKLGTIDDMSAQDIRTWLSGNPVSLTLSVPDESGIAMTENDASLRGKVFDLNGNPVGQWPPAPGVYLVDGKKTIIK